jgi:hypothetical protein
MSLATTSKYGLLEGKPAIKSVGPLAMGPDGILFVADNASAKIFAIDLGDSDSPGSSHQVNVDHLDTRLAAFLGCPKEDVVIRDMAVHPTSENVYLSVTRGTGDAAIPLLIKVGADGSVSELVLEGVPFAETAVPSPPAMDDERTDGRVLRSDDPEGEDRQMSSGRTLRMARDRLRNVAVTDLAYVDGVLLVAGASNEEFSSSLRRIPFPFQDAAAANSLEIFHVSHGRYETASPIRTFLPYGGGTNVVASYTCTPVVHFAVNELQPGTHVMGRTVADLGAGNTPLDIVSYQREGQDYLLISNTRHPLIRIACRDIDAQEPLTQPKEPMGVPRDNMPQEGVSRMANLNGSYVLMMQRDEGGDVNLRSYATSSL